ncbi:MAG TPA: TetR/AcrR family transcriptional regulator [Candidatus Limnocylindrales bacterium]
MSPADGVSVEPARHRGRGRSKRLDVGIAQAALKVLVQRGTAGFSVVQVAREVGCSKSSIYRRHGTRENLILDAANCLLNPGSPPIGVSGTLGWLIDSRVEQLSNPAYVVASAMLIDEAARGTELGLRYVAEVFEPLRRARIAVAQRAKVSGEFRPDADLDLLLDAISGTLLFRAGHRIEFDAQLSERLVALFAIGVEVR